MTQGLPDPGQPRDGASKPSVNETVVVFGHAVSFSWTDRRPEDIIDIFFSAYVNCVGMQDQVLSVYHGLEAVYYVY